MRHFFRLHSVQRHFNRATGDTRVTELRQIKAAHAAEVTHAKKSYGGDHQRPQMPLFLLVLHTSCLNVNNRQCK